MNCLLFILFFLSVVTIICMPIADRYDVKNYKKELDRKSAFIDYINERNEYYKAISKNDEDRNDYDDYIIWKFQNIEYQNECKEYFKGL